MENKDFDAVIKELARPSRITAVEYLIEMFDLKTDLSIINQAKEMEKQQVIDAYYRGIQEQTQRALFKDSEITEPEIFKNK